MRTWFRDLGHAQQAAIVGAVLAALITCGGSISAAILTSGFTSDLDGDRPTNDAPLRTEAGHEQTYFAGRPGCEADGAGSRWTTATSTLDCGGIGTTLRKSYASNGNMADNNAELRFRRAGQSFPSNYQVSVTVSRVTDPDATSPGACAGLSTHANAEGTTFEELSVCSDGLYAFIKILNGVEVDRDEGRLPNSGTFNLRADVTADTVAFAVDNGRGVAGRLTGSAVSSDTSYIALTVFWKSAGATAEFSNFEYRG